MMELIALGLLLVHIPTTLSCTRVGPDKQLFIPYLLGGDHKVVFHLGGITDPGTYSEAQIVMGDKFPRPTSFVEAKFYQRRPEIGSEEKPPGLYSHIESAMQSNITVSKFGRKAKKSLTILSTSIYNALRPGMYKEYMERVEFHFKGQDVNFFIGRMAERGESAFFTAEASPNPKKVLLSTLNADENAATDILFNCPGLCRHIRLFNARPNHPLLKADEPQTKFEILFAASSDENGFVVSAKLDEYSESNMDIIFKPNNPLTVKTRGSDTLEPSKMYEVQQNGKTPLDITGNSEKPFGYFLYYISFDGYYLQVTIKPLPITAFSIVTDEQRYYNGQRDFHFQVELKENFKYGFSYFGIALPPRVNSKASLIVAVTNDDESRPCNPGVLNNIDPQLPAVISGSELANISYVEPEIIEQGTDDILENISKHLPSNASGASRYLELLIFSICGLIFLSTL